MDNTLTYLQTAFDPLRYPQQILQMEQHFAGEVMSHIEFLRDIEGISPPAVCSWCAIPRPNVLTPS
ncbi:FAD/FMN-containing dehydrogenase [Klebsiella pneumoniae]|uniref:FAD/FMN-containing dehydrogenase n=1 Tax=Klebsiella pneumoniae TaxID=573 RepID=A0A378F5U8_KLEPN|nr:FAD/FMN-containing dehydrogenase [Klebsiella pneumoniae]